jgi:hypothetical protein
MSEHYPPEDFEQIEVGPCICGCGAWLEWDDDVDAWVQCDDPFRYYVVDPEYKTKGDEVIALVVKRGQ